MKVQAGAASLGRISASEPTFEQFAHEVRTECVGGQKKGTRLAVDRTVHASTVNHVSTMHQIIPEATSVKPLFLVGSYVLAQIPRGHLG